MFLGLLLTIGQLLTLLLPFIDWIRQWTEEVS